MMWKQIKYYFKAYCNKGLVNTTSKNSIAKARVKLSIQIVTEKSSFIFIWETKR